MVRHPYELLVDVFPARPHDGETVAEATCRDPRSASSPSSKRISSVIIKRIALNSSGCAPKSPTSRLSGQPSRKPRPYSSTRDP